MSWYVNGGYEYLELTVFKLTVTTRSSVCEVVTSQVSLLVHMLEIVVPVYPGNMVIVVSLELAFVA